MKTREEFENFIINTPEIADILSKVGKKRKANVRQFLLMFVAGMFFCGIMVYFSVDWENMERLPLSYLLTMGGFILFSGVYSIYNHLNSKVVTTQTGQNGFTFELKDKVIRRIIGFFNPTFRYEIKNYVPLWKILESNMFQDKEYKIKGNDLVRGKHNNISFEFSDIELKKERLLNTRKDDFEDIVLSGSFFIADFNKEFKNPVYIFPKYNGIEDLQCEGQEIKLESPEFSKAFIVYSTNQIECRRILTPSMMDRIQKLARTMGKSLHIVFANNRIYIANNNGYSRFSALWNKSVNRKEKLIEYFEEMKEQLNIIDELKLNADIWKK